MEARLPISNVLFHKRLVEKSSDNCCEPSSIFFAVFITTVVVPLPAF